MKKKIITLMLAITMISTACGNQAGTAVAPSPESESQVEETASASTEAVTDNSSYAVKNGLEFGTLSDMEHDFSYIFFDTEKREVVDSEDYKIVEKGKGNFKYLGVKTWPSEKEGYTVARISYATDGDVKIHSLFTNENESVRSNSSIGGLTLFDFYTGKVIPTYKTRKVAYGSEVQEKEEVETEIDYEGNKWDVTAWSEMRHISYMRDINMPDGNHYDADDVFLRIVSLYVIYPDDYDGLSFAFDKYEDIGIDEVVADLNKDLDNEENDVIGKDILSTTERSKDSYIFCTVKDSDSVKVENYASEEEAGIISYAELYDQDTYNGAGEASSFYLPVKFLYYNGSDELLAGNALEINDPLAEFKIGSVTSEDQGEGNTKISMDINIAKDMIFASSANKVDDVYAAGLWFPFGCVTVYNRNSGAEIEINNNENDKSSWGDWMGDSQVGYNLNYNNTVDFIVPTEELENTTLLFGDRDSSDHIQFKLSELIK